MNAYEELCNEVSTAVADMKAGVCDIGIIIQNLERALKKPRRNCDVGTAKEQSDMFCLQCNDFRATHGNCFSCPCLTTTGRCEFNWAQMTYKE